LKVNFFSAKSKGHEIASLNW